MDRMVTTTTWIKALALRNAKVAKVFWGLLAAISCFFCNPRYIINSVFIIPQIDTGKREMDQRDIDPLKSVKNKHLMWKGCKICKITTVIKKIWSKPKVTISVFIYTVYSLPSFRSRIVKHSELSAMRDIMESHGSSRFFPPKWHTQNKKKQNKKSKKKKNTIRLTLFLKAPFSAGQSIINPWPECFSHFGYDSLTKLPFGVTSASWSI